MGQQIQGRRPWGDDAPGRDEKRRNEPGNWFRINKTDFERSELRGVSVGRTVANHNSYQLPRARRVLWPIRYCRFNVYGPQPGGTYSHRDFSGRVWNLAISEGPRGMRVAVDSRGGVSSFAEVKERTGEVV